MLSTSDASVYVVGDVEARGTFFSVGAGTRCTHQAQTSTKMVALRVRDENNSTSADEETETKQ